MTSKDKTATYGGMKPNAFDRYLKNPDPPVCDDGGTHHHAGTHGEHVLTGKVLNAMMQPSSESQNNHNQSKGHRECVQFLYNRMTADVRDQRQNEQEIAYRNKSRSMNRHFFGLVVKTVLHLASMGDALYGHTTDDGKVMETLRLMSTQTPYISKYLTINDRHAYFQRSTHPTVIDFILGRMTMQLLEAKFKILNECMFACIIADEWSTIISSKEYTSVSVQYVTERLEVDTIFLGYIPIKSTGSEDVTNAIIKALRQMAPDFMLDFNKVVGQTYDGAANMQGHRTGVQQRIRSEHCFFAVPNHCWNHQIQLAIKKETNGHILICNTLNYVAIIVKLYKYSPKRSEMLMDIKMELRNEYEPNEFTTTVGKVLGLCITRWTCRSVSLRRIKEGYVAQLIGFGKLMITQESKQALNAEHTAEVIGMMAKKQSFEFWFGLNLAIVIFGTVEKRTIQLQGQSLNASKGIHIVKTLIKELEKEKSDHSYENFWEDIIDEGITINDMIAADDICQRCPYIDGLEEPTIPRQFIRDLEAATADDEDEFAASKAYWKEFYISAFDSIIDNLKKRLDSEMLKLILEIENILVDLIDSPNSEIKIEEIVRNYGAGSGKPGAPFTDDLTIDLLKEEMKHVRDEWKHLRQRNSPECVDDVVNMMKESFQEFSIREWKLKIPNILKLLAIMTVIAATSAFAERTFSLARRLNTYLRSQMKDETFHKLGILAWYDKEDIDGIIDFV